MSEVQAERSFEISPEFLKLPLDEVRVRVHKWAKTLAPWKPHASLATWLKQKHVGIFSARPEWAEPEGLDRLAVRELSYAKIVENELRFVRATSAGLVPNPKFSVLEPEVSPEASEPVPEVLLVPCLIASRSLDRIGRGGGFYDRFLRAHPQVVAVGVVHSSLFIPEIPPHWLHAGDEKLEGCCTEKEFVYGI